MPAEVVERRAGINVATGASLPLPAQPHCLSSMLEFVDRAEEIDYKAARFRHAYSLHMSYWSFLALFFLVGLSEPSFFTVSATLAPLFLLLAVARALLHQREDHHAAQRVGSLVIAAADSVIWLVAMLIFQSSSINTSFLILGLYLCCVVVYPIVLFMRAHTFQQVVFVLVVAISTVIASPSWSSLSWADQVLLNLAAFALGLAIACMIERLQRISVHERKMRLRDLTLRQQADSALNHMLKNKFASSQFLLSRAVALLEEEAPAALSSQEDERESESEGKGMRAARCAGDAPALLWEVHALLGQCAEWTHRREVFVQLEAGTYQSSTPLVDAEALLRRLGGDDVEVACCARCDTRSRVAVDAQMLSIQLEEALANALKYREPGSRIEMVARIIASDDDGESADASGGDCGGAPAQPQLHVTLTNRLRAGLPPMSAAECEAVFSRGAKGCAGKLGRAAGSVSSSGVGLSTVRLAAAAARGAAWLGTRLDAHGVDHVAFHCTLPVLAVEAAPSEEAAPRCGAAVPVAAAATAASGAAETAQAAQAAGPSEAELMQRELAELIECSSAPPPVPPAPPPAHSLPLVCVGVDDDPLMLVMLGHAFEQLGAVRCHVLGESLEEQRASIGLALGHDGAAPGVAAHLAVLDQSLGTELSGAEIATQLRARGFAGIVVIHTGSASHEVRALEALPGIDAVVVKGVGRPLHEQLQQLLRTHWQRLAALPAPAPAPSPCSVLGDALASSEPGNARAHEAELAPCWPAKARHSTSTR